MIKYVLGAIVLIALLIAAANLLFGYNVGLTFAMTQEQFVGIGGLLTIGLTVLAIAFFEHNEASSGKCLLTAEQRDTSARSCLRPSIMRLMSK